jgi:hypothetical protein
MLFSASALPLVDAEVDKATGAFSESPTIEEYVRIYFYDIPIMAEVAHCESRFRHFDKRGYILRGEVNQFDVGVMQINEHYHLKQAESLGYNLYSLDGNLGYARHLYKKEGIRPWNSSSACWDKTSGEHLARS